VVVVMVAVMVAVGVTRHKDNHNKRFLFDNWPTD
jgi:hypothetical protein